MMDFQTLLHKVVLGDSLTEDEMVFAMDRIMEGEIDSTLIASFLTALRMKGESVEEILGAARVMRKRAQRLDLPEGDRVDTCGTGGDGADTFNISTASAFVVAGAGVVVAKHGNRAVSSKSGSADVLKSLGVNIDAETAVVERCICEAGIGFLFAPLMHKAMKHAVGVRKQLGFRTLFNLLGPLTNPAGSRFQVLGVFDDRWLSPLAHVLLRLGSSRALVVQGEDGLDEITLTGPTRVCELRDGQVNSFQWNPEQFGLNLCKAEDLKGGDPDHNAEVIRDILSGKEGPPRDIVLLNSAAALYVCGKAEDMKQGIEMARESIQSGSAKNKLKELGRISHGG